MGAAELYLREVSGAIAGARRILLQRLIGTFQREVDLAFDPGQRADIEFHRCIHVGQCLRSLRWNLRNLEACNRTLEFGCQAGQFANRRSRLLRTGRCLFGDAQNVLHLAGHTGC